MGVMCEVLQVWRVMCYKCDPCQVTPAGGHKGEHLNMNVHE